MHVNLNKTKIVLNMYIKTYLNHVNHVRVLVLSAVSVHGLTRACTAAFVRRHVARLGHRT